MQPQHCCRRFLDRAPCNIDYRPAIIGEHAAGHRHFTFDAFLCTLSELVVELAVKQLQAQRSERELQQEDESLQQAQAVENDEQ